MKIIIFLLFGCATKSNISKKQDSCGNLSDALHKVTQAEDPHKYAQENSLLDNDGRIRVMLTLKDGTEAFWVSPIETELSISTRYQLLVPPVQLCALAQDTRVVSIDVPKKGSSKKSPSKKVSPK
tara:strand:+ start:80 stop:454 length:375 start_codon:yes stop_codon:yes gene_type:complete